MPKPSLIQSIGNRTSVFAEQFVPDPWIYAIFLTALGGLAAVLFTPSSAWQATLAWQEGFWNPSILLLVAQFSFNLVLCTTLARTPAVQAVLIWIARFPSSAFSAIWLITTVSILLSLISWALCIVGGALFAQEVCRQARLRKIKLHYPLCIASGYIGMMTWGCGLTSSAALISSTPGHFLQKQIGIIPTSQTLLSPANLIVVVVLGGIIPLLMGAMHPHKDIIEYVPDSSASQGRSKTKAKSFSETLEQSPWILKLGALLPLSYLLNYYVLEAKSLTLNSMNLIFLCAVLVLYSTPRQMLDELSRASQSVWTIVFQFPFYAGLMGLIQKTGLGTLAADFFTQISSPLTWPTIGVVFSGLLNLFVPSGGTQWFVTGEILIETSHKLGYSPAQAILIEVMGDQLTNMIQPMWALPALALAGLQARNIMGYTFVAMSVAFGVMCFFLTVLPG